MTTGADYHAQARRNGPPFTATETRQDYEQSERFLLLLDETAESFTFQTFTDCKVQRETSRKNGQGDPLARVLHGSLEHCWRGLCRLNDQGAGVYVTVNETDGNGRTADHITRVRAVFEEQDTANKPPADYPLATCIDGQLRHQLLICYIYAHPAEETRTTASGCRCGHGDGTGS
jgi:hypothetical protein